MYHFLVRWRPQLLHHLPMFWRWPCWPGWLLCRVAVFRVPCLPLTIFPVMPTSVFQYHFNPSQSVLVMEGDDIGNINRALQKVSYINSRQFPTAGVRRLRLSSKVQWVTIKQPRPSWGWDSGPLGMFLQAGLLLPHFPQLCCPQKDASGTSTLLLLS